MSIAGRTVVCSIVALLVMISLAACDTGDDDGEEELVPRACACCAYAEGICEKACDCDPTEQCTLLYPSGNHQAWANYSVCVAKLTVYCRENLVPSVLIEVCDTALAAAACAETEDGLAFAVPTACLD